LDKTFDLCVESEFCGIYTPAQVADKIKGGLTPIQEARFRNVLQRENATLGSDGFPNPLSNDVLKNSARNLSFKGYTVVIAKRDEFENVNNRVVYIEPSDFDHIIEEAEKLKDLLDINKLGKNYKLIDFLILLLFKEGVAEKMRDIFTREDSSEGILEGRAELTS